MENNWSKARRFPRYNVDLIFYCLFIKASHELPGSCYGQQIKDQPESIDFPSGQRKSEMKNKTHTSCCFMVGLV